MNKAGTSPLSRHQGEQAVAMLPAGYGFVRPLATSALDDDLDLLAFGDPAARWPGRHLRLTSKPTVLLIGDDPGCSQGQGGPNAWSCATAIGRWCKGAIVHAAGGEAAHYAEAVRGAHLLGRIALIETTTAHALAWVRCIGCPTTLLILPTDGPHPVERVLH